MVREIPLTQGKVALVDDWNYQRVTRFKWCAVLNGKHWYAKRCVKVDGRVFNVYLHRFLMGLPDAIHIDHRNGDGLDCREENIRAASQRQNRLNQKAFGASGFKGVQRFANSRYFAAKISKDGRATQLGTFATADEAARVYDAAARRLHGEFAWTNFPDTDPEADAIAERVLAGGERPIIGQKPRRLLSDEQVIAIRARYAAGGIKIAAIAAEYGVSIATIGHLISGRTFADVGEPLPADLRKRLHFQHARSAA